MARWSKMQPGQRVHILGISGTLMGSFALFLKRQGLEVSGSDAEAIYPPMSELLAEAGILVLRGYAAQNLDALPCSPDWVLVGNVIRRENPEMQAVIQKAYPYLSLPEAMEKWMLTDTHNIVIAGTHGKTTTTAWMAFTLKQCGKDPGYFIGGVPWDLPVSFQTSQSLDEPPKRPRFFVLEGDEYDTAFWDKVPKFNHYLPRDVILTSIEFDHADIYSDLSAVQRAFEGLIQRLPPGGRLIVCWNDPIVRQTVTRVLNSHTVVALSCIKYGQRIDPSDSEDLDFYFDHLKMEGEWLSFEVYARGGKWQDTLKIQLTGAHSALNALAVWIEARALGLEPNCIKKNLSEFRGVKRRQEVRAEVGGVLVLDDFAHHPTAVRETLKGLRLKYPLKRILAIFEPRSATSRRKVFQKEYVNAFLRHADQVWVAEPYDLSRIDLEQQFSSGELVQDLRALGQSAFLLQSVDEGVEVIAAQTQPEDLVVVLSNGGFQNLIPKLIQCLKKKTH